MRTLTSHLTPGALHFVGFPLGATVATNKNAALLLKAGGQLDKHTFRSAAAGKIQSRSLARLAQSNHFSRLTSTALSAMRSVIFIVVVGRAVALAAI